MRVISKKISYNEVISKLPGVIPSIMDSWVVPFTYNCNVNENNREAFFSYETAVKKASQYNVNVSQLKYYPQFVNFDINTIIEFNVGNYGLIPSDIIIPTNIAEKITDYTDFYVNLPDNNGGFYDLSWPKNTSDPHYEGRKIISGETEIKILTYSTLTKWFYFFKNYYNIVENPDYKKTYDTAIDYYNEVITVKNDEQEKYYKTLDDVFISRGGEEMYKWICDNCIIQFKIPHEFVDEWNVSYLYYPDAIKWYLWFKERQEKYENINKASDCKSTDDCCDCIEYIRLGGNDFYTVLKNWVDNVNINTDFATNSASISIPISVTNYIDDLGEMAIFSNKWKEEQDYHNTLSNKPGTVVNEPYLTNNDTGDKEPCEDYTYIIKGGEEHKGYEYNSFYENVFKESDWSGYTDYYIDNNRSEFVSSGYVNNEITNITSYTYSPINGKIIWNPNVDGDEERISEIISISKYKNVCIKGNTYDIINGKYVELCYDSDEIANSYLKSGKKLMIKKDGNMEYCLLNGKKYYVEYDGSKEVIRFLKGYDCNDTGCEVKEGEYIVYDSELYFVNNDFINIEDETESVIMKYPVLDGYFDAINKRFYISGSSVVIQDSSEYSEDAEKDIYTFTFKELNEEELHLLGIKKIIIDLINIKAIVYYDFNITNCKFITGKTDSKLDILRRKEITTDDLGNELPGYFKSIVDIKKTTTQSAYNLPYDECTLDILYKVGEVSNLKEIEENKFLGNIITSIEFYYNDIFGNKVKFYDDNEQEISFIANNDNALEQIDLATNAYNEVNDESIVNILMCDITYHLGATIIKEGKTYSIDSNSHTGVKYIDTVYVRKELGKYYLNDDKYFTFKYYLLSQDVNTVYLSDFKTNVIWDASTKFEFEPLLYVRENNSVSINDNARFKDFSKNNGVAIAPVFRNEFNLASSLPQNVDANIYIDRGINAAYEKLLKLEEFRTIEAMENYGNGWFKINEY